jgi:hypothetical protein
MTNDELTTAVRECVADVHTATPAEQVIRRGRAVRARRRAPRVAGALALAGGAALAVTALLPASHQRTAQLAAWTVAKQSDGTITVAIREMNDPAALQRALRADGLPVSVGLGKNPACQRYFPLTTPVAQQMAVEGRVVQLQGRSLSSFVMTIHPSALPSGAGLEIYANVHGKPFMIGTGPLVQTSPQCTGG